MSEVGEPAFFGVEVYMRREVAKKISEAIGEVLSKTSREMKLYADDIIIAMAYSAVAAIASCCKTREDYMVLASKFRVIFEYASAKTLERLPRRSKNDYAM